MGSFLVPSRATVDITRWEPNDTSGFKGGKEEAAARLPLPVESDHDYLWRVHQQVPSNGEIVERAAKAASGAETARKV